MPLGAEKVVVQWVKRKVFKQQQGVIQLVNNISIASKHKNKFSYC